MGVLVVPNFRSDRPETGYASGTAKHYCEQLESGHILLFTETPFSLNPDDRQFLLDVRQSSAQYHKNISYRPVDDRIRGVDRRGIDVKTLRNIMRTYSRNVSGFVRTFLSPYARVVRQDFASFRPIEEQGRKMPIKARNDLVHVDAFPTRPTNGDRILRVFTNIHPTQPRGWVTGDTFDILATQMAADSGLPAIARQSCSSIQRALHQFSVWLRKMGLPVKDRSPYDRFML
jgi:3-deoxy-D-manno-oct-2-ulosonic acid (Kdo) hydroxylase